MNDNETILRSEFGIYIHIHPEYNENWYIDGFSFDIECPVKQYFYCSLKEEEHLYQTYEQAKQQALYLSCKNLLSHEEISNVIAGKYYISN